jgi:transcriptional regulator GlxA family with amidase domain
VITRSRQVALLLFNEVEVLDFAGLLQVITLAGRHWNWRPFKIHAVAEQPGLISTCNQVRIEAPVSLSDCPPPEIVILPGGYGAILAAKSSALVSWLSEAIERAEAVVCVGNGALLLAATERCPGETLSVSSNAAASLLERHSTLLANTSDRLTLGQKVLSARTSEGSLDLGLELVQRFLGASLKKRVQSELMLINGEPPALDLENLAEANGPGDPAASDSSRR